MKGHEELQLHSIGILAVGLARRARCEWDWCRGPTANAEDAEAAEHAERATAKTRAWASRRVDPCAEMPIKSVVVAEHASFLALHAFTSFMRCCHQKPQPGVDAI